MVFTSGPESAVSVRPKTPGPNPYRGFPAFLITRNPPAGVFSRIVPAGFSFPPAAVFIPCACCGFLPGCPPAGFPFPCACLRFLTGFLPDFPFPPACCGPSPHRRSDFPARRTKAPADGSPANSSLSVSRRSPRSRRRYCPRRSSPPRPCPSPPPYRPAPPAPRCGTAPSRLGR